MVDLQSFIWVAFRESGHSTAGLDTKAQIELDQPAANDTIAPAVTLRERETAILYTPQSAPFHPSAALPLSAIADATGFAESDLSTWLQAIERKGQAILYGPPGTGKTFLAEKLAQYLVSGGDGFHDLVQFHPAYSYEEFIQGIRPQTQPNGSLTYPVLPGRFLEFCHAARLRTGRCVLIIDEINRANLSRVFGELMYLLEYRNRDVPLAGGGRLAIPANVYLIGTMNTADRSIALVDYALRRRFAFLPLYPNYDLLRRYHQRQQTGFDPTGLIKLLTRLNNQIGDPHYAVGITFFLHPDLPAHLENIWRTEIEPYLEEYFYDRPEQVTPFRWPAVHAGLL
jgi:5-methylcytosine-specific restriction protein B